MTQDDKPVCDLTVGKLYRVNAYAIHDSHEYGHHNLDVVRDHGFIWVCEAPPDYWGGPDMQSCRSIITGEVHPWSYEEMEEVQ